MSLTDKIRDGFEEAGYVARTVATDTRQKILTKFKNSLPARIVGYTLLGLGVLSTGLIATNRIADTENKYPFGAPVEDHIVETRIGVDPRGMLEVSDTDRAKIYDLAKKALKGGDETELNNVLNERLRIFYGSTASYNHLMGYSQKLGLVNYIVTSHEENSESSMQNSATSTTIPSSSVDTNAELRK